ncbi:MAG: DUF3822 family protein [Bacteroidia bacterium]|nr:DUF3822 family protein [Bacteroidia bacterium]
MDARAYTTKFQASGKSLPGEKLSASLLVTPVSFMYALSTNGYKNVFELAHLTLDKSPNTRGDNASSVSYLIHNFMLHQKKLDKIHVAILNSEFTMAPEAFALDREMKPLLQFVTGAEQNKRSQKHHLNQLDFFYGVDTELATSIERLFPNVSIRHAGAINISLLFSHHTLALANIFLNVSEGFIELAARENKNLLFYNIFSYSTNEDILYYLLFMMEQFNLNPIQVRLAIAGERPVQDELFVSIKKYIKNVNFCVHDKSIHLGEGLSSLPDHHYFTLLNQHLCEL